MAVIVLNHPSSGGLLPTPPPTCRLLHHSLLTPFNHRQSTTDETVTKSKWKGRSSSIPSRNRSPSTSPPRNSYKRHKKTEVDPDEEKKERYSGAAFFSASPAPQSLPLPTFLFSNKKNDKDATCTAKGTATDVDNLGRRRQYPRDLLLSLSKSVPTCLPPQLHRSEIRDLDSRRW